MTTNRKYYACYCEYGVDYDYKFEYYDFLVFDSKAERNAWVLEHEWDGNKYVAKEVTRRDIEYAKGKNFHIINDDFIVSHYDFLRNTWD